MEEAVDHDHVRPEHHEERGGACRLHVQDEVGWTVVTHNPTDLRVELDVHFLALARQESESSGVYLPRG